MRPIKNYLLVLVAALLPATLLADAGRFQAVKGWKGRVTLQHKFEHAQAANGVSETWKLTRSAEMEVRLDHYDESLGAWVGSVSGPGSVDYSYIAKMDGFTMFETWKGRGDVALEHGGGKPRGFFLSFLNEGSFNLEMTDPYIVANVETNFMSEQRAEAIMPALLPHTNLPVPAEGFRLHGSTQITQDQMLFSLGSGAVVLPFVWELTWDLEPLDVDELEVVVDVPGHDNWRPTAGPAGLRGNTIDLIARLQKKGGGDPGQKAVKFEWEFFDVSREPGYAMNMPTTDPDRKPDLRFEPSPTLLVLGDESTAARTTEGERVESTATVSSWDWGGWGSVRVTATLADGRTLVGTFKGDSEILLPKRVKGRLIAESWLHEKGVAGKQDAADDENDPVGDGNAGDGFTLYEEYRGFIENGDHIEADPLKKDYFISNRAGGLYVPGIRMFGSESGLAVHYELGSNEFPVSRVMNLNHRAAPHNVDQHGVEIEPGPVEMSYAFAEGGPGTPRDITRIVTPRLVGSLTSANKLRYMHGTLAHELLHASNVYHHGDLDERQVNWRRKPGAPDGVFLESDDSGEREVRVLRENGSTFDAVLPETGINVTLGAKQGLHSGNDQCLMRYDVSGGYVADSDPDLRYRVREKSGYTLCSESAGTGVNDPLRQPQSRYSGAGPNRGDCRHQILVNDAVSAIKR